MNMALQLTEDESIRELRRDSRPSIWTMTTRAAKVALPITVILMTASMLGAFNKPMSELLVNGELPPIAAIVVFAVAFTSAVVWGGESFATTANAKARKLDRKRIRKARRAAKSLGTSVVPLLTKEHVEARIRVDDILHAHVPFWKQSDSDGLCKLLFADLSREPVIISLITERGMTTYTQVREALADIESNPKPLQNGWL